jgi:hypothetical protein
MTATRSISLAGLLCLALTSAGCGGHSQISSVQNGVLKAIPTTTLGKYFDGVYQKADWEYQESAIGEKIVIAKGYVRGSAFSFASLDELRRALTADKALEDRVRLFLVTERVAVGDSERQACTTLTGARYPECLKELDRKYPAEVINAYLGDDLSLALARFRETEPRASAVSEEVFVDAVKPLLKRVSSVKETLKAPLSELDYKEAGLSSCKELASAGAETPVSGTLAAAIRRGGGSISLVPYECVPASYLYEEWRFVIDAGKEETFHMTGFKPFMGTELMTADEFTDSFWATVRRRHEAMLESRDPVVRKREALKELN